MALGIQYDTVHFISGHVGILRILKISILCRVYILSTLQNQHTSSTLFWIAIETTHTLLYIRVSNLLYHMLDAVQPWRKTLQQNKHKNEDLSSWPAAHGASSDCDSCAKAVGAVYWESYCSVPLKDIRKLHWNRCLMLSRHKNMRYMT